jgi:hypothetical protein
MVVSAGNSTTITRMTDSDLVTSEGAKTPPLNRDQNHEAFSF